MSKIFEAVYFDLDGTLVDSKLDFDLMRDELNFPESVPILEHIDSLTDEEEIKAAHELVLKHELKGARESEIYPGVIEFINYLKQNNIATAILTRNCKQATKITLDKFNIDFFDVITREDFPAKPDPSALLYLSKKDNVAVDKAVYIGDYKFDLEAASNAGMSSGLFLNDRNRHFSQLADFSFSCYHELLLNFKAGSLL